MEWSYESRGDAVSLWGLLRKFGVPVTVGSDSSYGILKHENVEAPGEFDVTTDMITLLVRDGDFSGLAQDVSLTAGGVSYKIRDVGRLKVEGTRLLVLVPASP